MTNAKREDLIVNELAELLLSRYKHLPDCIVRIPTVKENINLNLNIQNILWGMLDPENPTNDYFTLGVTMFTEYKTADGKFLDPVSIDYLLNEHEKGTITLSHRHEDGKSIITGTQKKVKE